MTDIELLEHLFDNYYQPLHVSSFEVGEGYLAKSMENDKHRESLLKAIENLNSLASFSWYELMRKCEVADYLLIKTEDQAKTFIEDYLVPKILGEKVRLKLF